ncbi:MAG: DNA polymerase II [Ignavibacteriaceae bacterium]
MVKNSVEIINVFLLTGGWQDIGGKNVLIYYGISGESIPVEIIIDNAKPVFFIDRSASLEGLKVQCQRKSLPLKSFSGIDADVLYFNTMKDLKSAAEDFRSKNISTFEADVDPARRYLMERFINVQMNITGKKIQREKIITFINPKIKPAEVNPQFKILSIDIETGANNNLLYSIAAHLSSKDDGQKIVFMIGDSSKKVPKYLRLFPDEKDLIKNFLEWFKECDPDFIIGWHVIGFDLMFLEKKFQENEIPFDLGRGKTKVALRKRKSGGYFAYIPGRVVIDGPPSLRAAFYSFEDFRLDTVAKELLGVGKTITPEQNKVKEIERLFKEDKKKLAEYNLQDAVLVTDIFKKTGLIDLSVKRAKLSGLLIDQLGMMTAAFDHFYLPKIHRNGFVAPNVEDLEETQHAAGGYVIDPKPGLYDDVIVLDFKSLYPSIIQTFKIDPVSRLMSDVDSIFTPTGLKFSSSKHFLPDFIAALMTQRTEAKKNNDAHLSQAIKILMNSFYGVMGSYGCRFYHPDLPTAITGTGQWLLLGSKSYLEQIGYEVLYGDTDSLFVKLKSGEGINADARGRSLALELNDYWMVTLLKDFKVKSYLEIEYEKYYRKFILTQARGSESGAKKRYAGLLSENGNEKLEFVGMEFVRSDWTRLAKDFQVELYKKVFNNEEITEWIRTFVNQVYEGNYNDKLIYRKRLRKDVDQYLKNIPPQVKAAKMIGTTGGFIDYVITKRGPVPVELDYSDIDYRHYVDKQLKPIADSILILLGQSFDEIIGSTQLNIFGKND